MLNENKSKRNMIIMLAVALFVILAGDLLASLIQTDFGKVKVNDVRFDGADGTVISALLYVPKGASASNKAPGILAIHGMMNNRETQDGFAIEFARRGYVVLAIDQVGHGYSTSTANSHGFGAPDALSYLRSLDIVDTNNIGMEGFSTGAMAVAYAANKAKADYKSAVMVGFGYPILTSTFPRNLAVIESEWDEWSAGAWGVPVAKDVAKSALLKKTFNTSEDVVVGKLYGSIADGTARKYYMPRNIHNGDHFSPAAIGNAIDWFQATLQGGKPLPPSDQIWLWKEIGNLIALIGMIMLFFPVASLLLRANFFKNLEEAPAKPKSAKGIGWWISALIIVILPPSTYFSFQALAPKLGLKTSVIFPESMTSGLLSWLFLVSLIAAALFLIWHFAFNRKAKATASDYGLTWGKKLDWPKIGKSFLLAAVVAFAGYLTLVISAWLFKVDYRFWLFNVKPMSLLHFRIFLTYLVPFILCFVAMSVVLNGQLRPTRKGNEMSLGSEMAINVTLLALGFLGLLAFQYIPFVMGGPLTYGAGDSAIILFTVLAWEIVPMLTIVALAYTYFYRKTGHIYAGAFLSAILVTWIVVASQMIVA
jgi:pimeloyl-ACP methyl ester carboxylesterase